MINCRTFNYIYESVFVVRNKLNGLHLIASTLEIKEWIFSERKKKNNILPKEPKRGEREYTTQCLTNIVPQLHICSTLPIAPPWSLDTQSLLQKLDDSLWQVYQVKK